MNKKTGPDLKSGPATSRFNVQRFLRHTMSESIIYFTITLLTCLP